MHLLYLRATEFGPRDTNKPGIQIVMLGQYLLDNAATVEEALALLDNIQPVMVELHGFKSTVHFAIEDASGDSAIIEYLKGKPVVHHGRQYQIMTNDPTYDEQLALLKKQDYSKPSMDMPLPGNVNAVDRFQRAAYYKAVLPEPKNEQKAVAGVLAIARNVSVPFGAPYHNFGIYNTEYRTVLNLTTKRYYFEMTNQPNVIWADLAKFDLKEGAPVMELDPHDIELAGGEGVLSHLVQEAEFDVSAQRSYGGEQPAWRARSGRRRGSLACSRGVFRLALQGGQGYNAP
jgi:penicillin V acylase-like amidase (Ntn superfamily)